MKFIVTIILTALLGFSWSLFFSWWVIAVAAFIVAVLIPQRPFKAFLSAFLALFILWGAQTLIIDVRNTHLLSSKVAAILPLGGSSAALILVTAFIGGLVGGMSALTGSLLRNVVQPAKINTRNAVI